MAFSILERKAWKEEAEKLGNVPCTLLKLNSRSGRQSPTAQKLGQHSLRQGQDGAWKGALLSALSRSLVSLGAI